VEPLEIVVNTKKRKNGGGLIFGGPEEIKTGQQPETPTVPKDFGRKENAHETTKI